MSLSSSSQVKRFRKTTWATMAAVMLLSVAWAASNRDLNWLRGKCPSGAALVHQYGGSGYSSESDLYLYEVSSGSRTKIGRGCQPEFSPDASLIAWMEGTTAKGCSRLNTGTTHVIATGVSKSAGVHWANQNEAVVVIGGNWYRVDVGTGARTAVPTLNRLGTGGTEIDVKYRGGDNWSYVAGTTWKWVDGAGGSISSGSTGGSCSPSLSPNGKSTTGLVSGHDQCVLKSIVPGGVSGTLRRTLTDCSSKGFDNHRWSSNDPRFVVAQYECQNKVGVWEVGTNDVYLFGDCTAETYGDFTNGAAARDWPGGQPADPVMVCDINEISFSYTTGDPVPAAKTVRVYTASGTLQGVSVGSTPSWLTATDAASSGTQVTVTNTVNVTGLAPGTYNATVSVTSSNAGAISYAVQLTVVQQAAEPSLTVVSPNGGETFFVGQTITISFAANEDSVSLVDIFLSPDGGENWYTITPGGSIAVGTHGWESYQWTIPETVEGVPTAGASWLLKVEDYNEGSGRADMSDGTFGVSVPGAVHKLINCGAGTVAGWEDGGVYAAGGTPFDFGQTFATAGVANTAPAEVYRTCRHRIKGAETGFSYVIPGIPDGYYTLRLHFGDASGSRSIDVDVNGTRLITDLDIVITAGGALRALVIDEQMSITGGAGMTIRIDDDRSNPADVFINGIEILSSSAPTAGSDASKRVPISAPARVSMQNGSIVIDLDRTAGPRTVSVRDIAGRSVTEMRCQGGTRFAIAAQDLAPGFYTVQVDLTNRSLLTKLRIVR